MGHMQNEITSKQDGWMVETNEGTCFVPGDVVDVPEWLKRDEPVTAADGDLLDLVASMVRDYVPGSKISEVQAISAQYFARLSAPGYLDCTDWCAFKTIKEAREYLRDM